MLLALVGARLVQYDGDRPALAVPALTAVLTLLIPVAFSATAGVGRVPRSRRT